MDFDKYKKLVTYYWQTDNRELNIQTRIIIPFLESILNYDIVDTSTIYSNQKKTNLSKKMIVYLLKTKIPFL